MRHWLVLAARGLMLHIASQHELMTLACERMRGRRKLVCWWSGNNPKKILFELS